MAVLTLDFYPGQGQCGGPPGRIALIGSLKDDSGLPLAGYNVELWISVDGAEDYLYGFATTYTDGSYGFFSLYVEGKTYRWTAIAPEIVPAAITVIGPCTYDPAVAEPTILTTSINYSAIIIPDTVMVSGKLTDSIGTPLGGRVIEIWQEGSPNQKIMEVRTGIDPRRDLGFYAAEIFIDVEGTFHFYPHYAGEPTYKESTGPTVSVLAQATGSVTVDLPLFTGRQLNNLPG